MDAKNHTRVGIIGGGPAGLAAIKSCLEQGFEPHVFERQEQLGGTWVYRESPDPLHPEAAAVYHCLKTNTSKALFGYSDFRPPPEWAPYSTHRQCLEYFQSYAKTFQLGKYIRFNTEVTKLYPADDYETTGRWRLRFRGQANEDVTEEEFDAVMICTGFYSNANLPAYPGQNTFMGGISTGNSYRNNFKYLNKKVLVVGGGISGGDIGIDISNTSKQTFISSRNGYTLTPLIGSNGWPLDIYTSRRFVQLFAPNFERWIDTRESEKRFQPAELGLFPPKRGHWPNGSVLNDNFINQVACGKIIPKPGIQCFTKTGVVFSDGSEVNDLDHVMFCTGYRNTIPFLDDAELPGPLGERGLYSYVFPAKMTHQTLACIGFIKVLSCGSPISVIEMQTRWVAQVWAGNCILPSKEEMLAAVHDRNEEHYTRYGRENHQIEAIPYMDQLASRIGCYPSFLKVLFSDPLLAVYMFYSPVVPSTYRLMGPHRWNGARAAILNAWNTSFEGTRCTKRSGQMPEITQALKFGFFALAFVLLFIIIVMLLS